MINFKQEELSLNLFQQLKERFPEIELMEIMESPVYRDHIWVRISVPEEEDRYMDLVELSSEIATDMLLDYGYQISTISGRRQKAQVVA